MRRIPVLLIFFSFLISCNRNVNPPEVKDTSKISVRDSSSVKKTQTDSLKENIKVLISTFRGNEKRNYYGNKCPSDLKVIWKKFIGKGYTNVSASYGSNLWYGAGWTGQPLLVSEDNKLFLIQGSFDHNLKKLDAQTGDIIWNYQFDDILKGTGTIWINKKDTSAESHCVIFQGSRKGYNSGWDNAFSFRAVSFSTGDELFRLNVRRTPSYSRDCDGSALVFNDTGYIGLENAIFTVFNPDYKSGEEFKQYITPEIISEYRLYDNKDISHHGGNLVTESSPALFNNKIYITAGSGHVYAYNILTKEIDWDFYTGSDMDGSPVVTSDSCILVPVEKQYIPGRGGILKLNPSKNPEESVEWFFPVKNFQMKTWEGGVIGTPAVNDETKNTGDVHLCAFTGIDGYLYVVNYKSIDGKDVGFDNKTYPVPELIMKYHIGSSISSPVIVGNKIAAAGYGGIFLFEFDKDMNFTLLAHKPGSYEASPIVYDNKLYIAGRDGYLYCYGE
jgi:outer membrane protein assembly factor BamB